MHDIALQRIDPDFHTWLQRRGIITRLNFESTDLSGMDFSGCKLMNASFRNANLTGCNFTGADLRKAVFVGANLTDATFTDANTDNAVFEE